MSATTSSDSAAAGQVFRLVRWLVIVVAAAQGLASLLTATVLYSPSHWPEKRPPQVPFFSANDTSRWATVWSLAERGTYQIDEIIQRPGWDTIDKVKLGDHFYSSKPPLLPTIVAGAYWLLKRTTGLDLLTQPHETVQVLLLLINLLPMVVSLVVIAKLGKRYAQTEFARMFLVFTAAWGTLLTPFLVTFNNHSIAAASVLFATAAAMRIVCDGNRARWRFVAAGAWGAFAVCNELPAFVFGLALFVMLLRRNVLRTWTCFVPAALVPIAAFLVTNWLAIGEWTPAYVKFGTSAYLYEHEGVPSYWMNPSGIDSGESSSWRYLLNCTIGHHGIWSLSPVFLVTVLAWWRAATGRLSDAETRRRGDTEKSARDGRSFFLFVWLSLICTVWVLGFYLAQTQSYNYGGNSAGLRWAFWLIPLWLVAMIPALDAFADRRWFRSVAGGCLAVSVFSAVMPHNNPWQAPWIQNVVENWGWGDHGTPVDPFPKPLRCWLASLPEVTDDAPQPWIEFTSTSIGGTPSRLRVQSVRREEMGEPAGVVRLIRITRLDDARRGQPTDDRLVCVAETAFLAGEWPKTFLRKSSPDVPDSQMAAAKRAVVGLPVAVEYRPGSVRYVKTPLRKNAFRCQLAVASFRHRNSDAEAELSYRRMLWLCPEVPFGVLQLEDTVTDPRDNAVVFRQGWTAVETGGR